MDKLLVQVIDGAGKPVEGALVHVDWFCRGDLVWSSVVGLTDEDGRVENTGLVEAYEYDQKLFSMDYKVSFEEFDALEVAVDGGADFEVGNERADSPLVLPEIKRMRAIACNRELETSRAPRVEKRPVVQVLLRIGAEAHAG